LIIRITGQEKVKETIALEEKVKKEIHFPNSLKNNMKFTTTSLGGLFLQFVGKRGRFTRDLNCETKYSKYVGDIGTLSIDRYNTPTLRGFKKPTDINQVIKRVNDYLSKNEQILRTLI
jgi:hypothetical protein